MKIRNFVAFVFLSYCFIPMKVVMSQNDVDTVSNMTHYEYYNSNHNSVFNIERDKQKHTGKVPLLFKFGTTAVMGGGHIWNYWSGGGFNIDLIRPFGKTLSRETTLALSWRVTNFLGVRWGNSDSREEKDREFYTCASFLFGFDILSRITDDSYIYFSVKPYGVLIAPYPYFTAQLDFGYGFKLTEVLSIEPYCTLQYILPIGFAGRAGVNFIFVHIRKNRLK